MYSCPPFKGQGALAPVLASKILSQTLIPSTPMNGKGSPKIWAWTEFFKVSVSSSGWNFSSIETVVFLLSRHGGLSQFDNVISFLSVRSFPFLHLLTWDDWTPAQSATNKITKIFFIFSFWQPSTDWTKQKIITFLLSFTREFMEMVRPCQARSIYSVQV